MRNVAVLLVIAVLAASAAQGGEPRPVMKDMPTTRRAVERETPPPPQPVRGSSRTYSTRTYTPSAGCLSGDCALARARAAQTVTRAEAMAELNERYRQRELQRQETRAAARARVTNQNQNIDAQR